MTEPRSAYQRGNEQRFWSDSRGFSAQMRFERRSMCGFPCENLGAVLVSSLPFAGFYDRSEKAVVHFQGSSKVLRNLGLVLGTIPVRRMPVSTLCPPARLL